MQSRRMFLSATAAMAGAAAGAAARPEPLISLAAWSLVGSFFVAKRWTNLDLPRIAREEFNIGALEFVNQFFDNPMLTYVQQLKRNADAHGVRLVRIMVDNEGDMAAMDRAERMQAAVAHRKWIDIAHQLGCGDIRCNMRGGLKNWREDRDLVKRAAEAFQNLLEYSRGSGLNVIVENHGGASSNPEILAALMRSVNDPRFGTLPDFGNVNPGDDRMDVIRKLLPYAKGVSVKAAWNEDGTHTAWDLPALIKLTQAAGFHGYWGIECNLGPRPRGPKAQPLTNEQIWANETKGVLLTKALLERELA